MEAWETGRISSIDKKTGKISVYSSKRGVTLYGAIPLSAIGQYEIHELVRMIVEIKPWAIRIKLVAKGAPRRQ